MVIILRLFMGLSCLGIGIALGYLARSPWVVLPLAGAFTIAFAIGRWRAWVESYKNGLLTQAIVQQAGTFIAQLILCGILYLIGSGVASLLIDERVFTDSIETFDWQIIAGFLVLNIVLGLFLIRLEKDNPLAILGLKKKSQDMIYTGSGDVSLRLEDDDITIDNIFSGHYYRNCEYKSEEEGGGSVVIEEKAFIDDAQIAAVEQQLGVRFPDALRRIYLKQNGGSGMGLYAPCPRDFNRNSEDGWVAVFSGYDNLPPVQDLLTVGALIDNYAFREEEPDRYPSEPDKMIVLASWYSETLFLDYRRGQEEPKVGFVDFDNVGEAGDDLSTDEWEKSALWWDDFDSFLSVLRRGRYERCI